MAAKQSPLRQLSLVSQHLQPVRRPRPRHPLFPCLHQPTRQRLQVLRSNSRPFSSSPANPSRYAAPGPREVPGQEPGNTLSPQLEQSARTKKGQQIPTDVGLIPQTFVYPTGANRPQWWHELRSRWRIEVARLRSTGYNLGLSFYYKWWLVGKPRPKLNYPFRTGRITAKAKELHGAMYEALAAGDTQTLGDVCADGILAAHRVRLSRRQPGETVEWSCTYLGRPKLVSHRTSVLPFKAPDGSTVAMRQAVVRLKTRQSLKRTVEHVAAKSSLADFHERRVGIGAGRLRAAREEPANEAFVTADKPKDLTEYIVIQRRLWKGEEEPWVVWGMTEETTAERLAIMQDDMKEMSSSRLSQAADSIRGRMGLSP